MFRLGQLPLVDQGIITVPAQHRLAWMLAFVVGEMTVSDQGENRHGLFIAHALSKLVEAPVLGHQRPRRCRISVPSIYQPSV